MEEARQAGTSVASFTVRRRGSPADRYDVARPHTVLALSKSQSLCAWERLHGYPHPVTSHASRKSGTLVIER